MFPDKYRFLQRNVSLDVLILVIIILAEGKFKCELALISLINKSS